MGLGEIDGTVSTVKCATGGVVAFQCGKSNAHRDVANLGKSVLFDFLAKPLQCAQRIQMIHTAHQHHKLLATKPVKLVMQTKIGAHLARQQQQHLVANQVSKVVIDAFEVVNVKNSQPVASTFMGYASIRVLSVALLLLFHGGPEKSPVKRLAIVQFGQRVFFTVVEHSLQVFVKTQDAVNQ